MAVGNIDAPGDGRSLLVVGVDTPSGLHHITTLRGTAQWLQLLAYTIVRYVQYTHSVAIN